MIFFSLISLQMYWHNNSVCVTCLKSDSALGMHSCHCVEMWTLYLAKVLNRVLCNHCVFITSPLQL